MFGMSLWEIGVILAIALIVVGPKKLPDLAKTLGRAMRELKKATRDFKQSMNVDEIHEIKKSFDDIKDLKNFSIDNVLNDNSVDNNDNKKNEEKIEETKNKQTSVEKEPIDTIPDKKSSNELETVKKNDSKDTSEEEPKNGRE